ncbi:unnamed protein product [Paramecium primaurelia]|uniref:Transmembrane protein n=1 Tax=Paramecium primaurelia TaxID=5886 RepID=A0A8S1LLI9_PARPR|nr:unnamed protein product [Paramecium primaurelia]
MQLAIVLILNLIQNLKKGYKFCHFYTSIYKNIETLCLIYFQVNKKQMIFIKISNLRLIKKYQNVMILELKEKKQIKTAVFICAGIFWMTQALKLFLYSVILNEKEQFISAKCSDILSKYLQSILIQSIIIQISNKNHYYHELIYLTTILMLLSQIKQQFTQQIIINKYLKYYINLINLTLFMEQRFVKSL